jgi:hypothetical protein
MTELAGFAGQKFFVPGFRIMTLGELGDRSAGVPLPPDVAFDVLSIKVTQNHTGISTYEIVLNNSHLATGADREDRQRSGREQTMAGYSRETYVGSNPAWPRWKYNDPHFFEWGKRLRIDMRYLPEIESREGRNDNVSRSTDDNRLALRDEWTPMIAGPITDITFDLVAGEEEQGMRVTISGHDDLGRLMDFQDWRCDMERYSEMSAVVHILSELGLKLPTAEPLVTPPNFVRDRTQGIRLARNPDQSSLDFLKELAERLDFEMFVGFDLSAEGHPLEFHFEPYRGRAAPDHPRRVLIPLERGKTLLRLSTKINVAEQYTEVSARGRAPETADVIEQRGRAQASALSDELRTPAGSGELTPAPLVREHFYPGRPNLHDPGNQGPADGERAHGRADALMRKKARELCVLNGDAIGIPRLRAGNHIELRGCRPPFDGYYYLTQTTHVINATGYRTSFTASRPGMELPDDDHRFKEDLS